MACQYRPDLEFEISQLAQVTKERFDSDALAHIERLNGAVRYAYDYVAYLKFIKLENSSLRIVKYSDAAFANNYDLTSQLRCLVLSKNNSNRYVPILFKIYKSGRVTRSVLWADVIALPIYLTTRSC